MLGLWPDCSYNGCMLPAVFQLRNLKQGQEVVANLCPLHVLESQKAIQEMDVLRQEDLRHLPDTEEIRNE